MDRHCVFCGPLIRFGYLGFKFPFPTRMTVLRLKDGTLWLHSPTNLTPSLKSEIDAVKQNRMIGIAEGDPLNQCTCFHFNMSSGFT